MRSDRGFLLPLALLGLLAVTALAMSSFVLARGLVRDSALERRYLEHWADPPAVDTVELAVGWELVRRQGDSPRSTFGVERVIEPDRESLLWDAAVFAPAISMLGDGDAAWGAGAGPLLNHFDALVESLSSGGEETDWASEVEHPAGPWATGSAVRVVGDDPDVGSWVLSDGDIRLQGEGTMRGILLARGAVTVGPGVRWEGAIAARGPVRVERGAELYLDPVAVEEALFAIPPPRRLAVPRGGPLGRF